MRRLFLLSALVCMAIGACSGRSDVSAPTFPAVTGTVATLPSSAPGAVPEGFVAVVLRVTDASGAVHEWCVLVADDGPKRARGLMDVDSLGGYNGMIFRFDAPTQSAFYMYKTGMPLSIAFFGDGGPFVSSTDMPPCTAADGRDCPLYRASAPYVDALEVPLGGLSALSVGPGSRIATGAACQRGP